MKDILKSQNLKRTSCREGILEAIHNSGKALSENEIRNNLQGNYDRTTFYRTFKTLKEKKIIHEIIIDSQTVKYALQHKPGTLPNHAHFHCNTCNTVKCLDIVPAEIKGLPNGYTVNKINILIKGTCNNCNQLP